jgi:hypothetical protein
LMVLLKAKINPVSYMKLLLMMMLVIYLLHTILSFMEVSFYLL